LPVSTRKSILIVDDEFGLAEMLRDMLRDDGFGVSLAINGRLALEILHERHVDLVITDLMMPVMDGIELAEAVRKDSRLAHVPIVLMTSLPFRVPERTGLYDAVIGKPFTPELLLDAINRCFELSARAEQGSNTSGEQSSHG